MDETSVRQTNQLKQQRAAFLETVDENRKSTSSLANILSSHENEIDVAMSNEGIAFPHSCLQQRDDATKGEVPDLGKHLQSMKRVDSKWDAIILGSGSRWLLGLGGVQTSGAFARYASFLQRGYQSLFQKGAVDIPDAFRDHITLHKHFSFGMPHRGDVVVVVPQVSSRRVESSPRKTGTIWCKARGYDTVSAKTGTTDSGIEINIS